MNQLSLRDLELHVKIVGWLYIAGSGLTLLIGAFLVVLFPTIGAASADPEAVTILGILGPAICILLAAISLPGLLAGFGLLGRYSWARILAIVVGLFKLLNFPLGTVMGAYALWVLFQESANEYFGPQKAS